MTSDNTESKKSGRLEVGAAGVSEAVIEMLRAHEVTVPLASVADLFDPSVIPTKRMSMVFVWANRGKLNARGEDFLTASKGKDMSSGRERKIFSLADVVEWAEGGVSLSRGAGASGPFGNPVRPWKVVAIGASARLAASARVADGTTLPLALASLVALALLARQSDHAVTPGRLAGAIADANQSVAEQVQSTRVKVGDAPLAFEPTLGLGDLEVAEELFSLLLDEEIVPSRSELESIGRWAIGQVPFNEKVSTPWPVIAAITAILAADPGTLAVQGNIEILDPCAGSMDLLLHVARACRTELGTGQVSLSGLDLDEQALRLGIVSYLLSRVEGLSLKVAMTHSLEDADLIRRSMGGASVVVADIPGKVRGYYNSFDWLILAADALSPSGQAFVVAPASTLTATKVDATKVKDLIDRGQVEAVVSLPPGLRSTGRGSLALWVLRGEAAARTDHPRGQGQQVLLVDASTPASLRDAGPRAARSADPELHGEWTGALASIVSEWRQDGTAESDGRTGLKALAIPSSDAVAENGIDLDPRGRIDAIANRAVDSEEVQTALGLLGTEASAGLAAAIDELVATVAAKPPAIAIHDVEVVDWVPASHLPTVELIRPALLPPQHGPRLPEPGARDDAFSVPVIDLAALAVDGRLTTSGAHFIAPGERWPITQANDVIAVLSPDGTIKAAVDPLGGNLLARGGGASRGGRLARFACLAIRIFGTELRMGEARAMSPQLVAFALSNIPGVAERISEPGQREFERGLRIPVFDGAEALDDWVQWLGKLDSLTTTLLAERRAVVEALGLVVTSRSDEEGGEA